MKHWLQSLAALLVLLGLSTPVAAGIVIHDNSFELPNLASGFSIVTPTGWDWNGLGIRGVTVENFVGFPASTDGDQWGFFRQNASLSQLIGAGMLQPNTTYQFSFFQFEQTNIADTGGGIQIEIWDGDPLGAGSLLDALPFAASGSGVLEHRMAPLNSGATATLGGDLYLALRAIPDLNDPSHVANVGFDEVLFTGTVSTVPEPSSLLLLGVGALGLFGYGRRRQKLNPSTISQL